LLDERPREDPGCIGREQAIRREIAAHRDEAGGVGAFGRGELDGVAESMNRHEQRA